MKTHLPQPVSSSAVKTFLRVSLAFGAFAAAGYCSAASWTKVAAPAPSAIGTMLLMTDGTVMAQGNPFNTWYQLAPSFNGSYAAGAWSPLPSMSTQRLYFASHVLPSGKLWILGGEYSGTPLASNIAASGEMYDPIKKTWSPIASHPEGFFGDDPSMLLNNGKILAGSIFSSNTYLYDIPSNTWSSAISKAYADRSDEETWVKLADGRVLTYDLFSSVDLAGQYAEVYDQKTNKWTGISPSDGTAKGSIPALSSAALGYEMGAIMKVAGPGVGGRLFVIGASGRTALYTPSTNTWAPGPDITGTLFGNPALFGAADAPAAVMPNGHVLFAADASPSAGLFSPPTQLFDYDPRTNTIKAVSPALVGSQLDAAPAFITRMLMLPTGQVLLTDGSNQLWIYTADGEPQPFWRPVYANVIYSGAGAFQLQGVRMNGPSAGSGYGDDAESDENYPVVRLQNDAGRVIYARTYNWSSNGIGQGVTTGTVSFTLPGNTPAGKYSIIVSGAGVSSLPRCISIATAQIGGTAPASPKAITCAPN